ncbi:MAG: nucleoside monophosphate kinase [Patescibacteria group bacterium]|nr:nucleoside monophosphate kinase [Patescibacteria group bacterium]
MELNTIFFIGPQGSGKGTQAKILAQKLNFFHWDMGLICRETAGQDTDFGREVKNIIDKGVYLSDDMLIKVAENRLKTLPANQGVIFDGIPRRLGQAQFLMDFLKKQGRKNFVTIYLSLPKDETFKRLKLRAEKEGRADDTEEAIELRLKQYTEVTLPVLDYLNGETTFFEVDGTPAVALVSQKINQVLGV